MEYRCQEVDDGYVAVHGREKGIIRRTCKNALRVCEEITERACVHSF